MGGEIMRQGTMVGILIVLLIILLLLIRKIASQKKKIQDIDESLKVALNGINVLFFEYYPEESRAVLLNQTNMYKSQSVLENYPECYYEKNVIHPDDLFQLQEMFSSIQGGASYAEVECRSMFEGKYHWYFYQMRPIYERDGSRKKVLVSKQDITLRKEIEMSYQNHLNALFFENPDTLISCRMNLSRNRLTGIYSIHRSLREKLYIASTVDDMLGKLAEYVMPSYREKAFHVFSGENLKQEFDKGNTTVRMEFSYKVGEDVRWAEAVAEMMQEPRNGEIDTIFHVTDNTKKRIMELILESVGNHDYEFLSFIYGKTQNFIRYNWLGTGDLQIQDNYGEKLLNYIDYHDVEDKETLMEQLQWSTIMEQLNQTGEYTVYETIIQKDGSRRRKKTQFFFIDDGEEMVLASHRDITDVYETEIRHRQVLAEALEQAQAANVAKTDFLSRMSHDIRTPMNAIIGITALALEETDNPEAVETNLAKINSASHFLLGLINDILDMSKIEDGSVELHREPYTYSDFINNLRTMFEPLCNEKGIRLEITESEDFPDVLTDRVRLNQIFFNIMSNAVKYTKKGGSVTYEETQMEIQDNIITVSFIISDTGIGMSKEFQKEMFKPFSQEKNEYTAQVQGTGLGLSITKSLVELMGGTIEIESELGKGTRITVTLSFEVALMSQVAAAKEKEQKSLDEAVLENKRILLVEDHPLNTEIAKRLLEKKKMMVYTADNGKKGVEKFISSDNYFFDAILMDIRMPEMDGLQAAREIRKLFREDAATVPIIAMTANAYDEDVQLSKEAGMNRHLSKPIQPDKLYETLSEMITEQAEKFAVK